MHVLHLDTETHPVTQDDPAPPPICLQWCIGPEPEIKQGAASPFLPHGEGGLEFDARPPLRHDSRERPATPRLGPNMGSGLSYLGDP